MTLDSAATTPVAAILFDFDGTLIDASHDIASGVNTLRAEYDLPPLSRDTVSAAIGNGARKLVERTLSEVIRGRGDTVDTDKLSAAHQRFLAIYEAGCTAETFAYDGTHEMLAALKEQAPHVGLGILTNKPESMTRLIVDHLGLDRYFAPETIIGADTLATKKPDPEGLVTLAERLGATAETTVLVGDSLVDADTAVNAGARSVLVHWGFTPAETLAQASPIAHLDTVAQLHQTLLGLIGPRP